MRSIKFLGFAAAAALWLGLPASGQNAFAQNVGVANPSKVFNEMQETKDLKVKLDDDAKKVKAEDDQKKAELQELQKARENFKAGTAPFDEANKKLLQKAIEYRAWAEVTQGEQQRIQKQSIRNLYDKIALTAGEVGVSKGMSIVIAEGPELPPNVDQLNLDQLQGTINQRNVLFADPKLDITADVITSLDAKYKAGGPATPAAPTPAAPTEGVPAPTPPAPPAP